MLWEENRLADKMTIILFNLKSGICVFPQSPNAILWIQHEHLDDFVVPRMMIIVILFTFTKKKINFSF